MLQYLSVPSVIALIGAGLIIVSAFLSPSKHKTVVNTLGGVLAAIGAFWSSIESSRKSDAMIQSITGGESYPTVIPDFKGDGKLTLVLVNFGEHPLYDLQVTIIDQDLVSLASKRAQDTGKSLDVPSVINQSQQIILVGNMGPSQRTEIRSVDLDQKTAERNYLFYLLARNGQENEEMRLRWISDRWSVAFKVYNERGTLKEEIGKDYPKDQLWPPSSERVSNLVTEPQVSYRPRQWLRHIFHVSPHRRPLDASDGRFRTDQEYGEAAGGWNDAYALGI